LNRLSILAALGLMAAVVGCTAPTPATPPVAGASAAPGTAQPSAAPAASAAPSAAANGGLAIAAGKKYHYKYTPESVGYVDFEIHAVNGDAVTYSGKTVITGRADQVDTNKTATKQNGVYWTSTEPNPVTKDIATYPEETVTVKAGTFTCRKVPSADGATMHWFAGPMIVKAANNVVSMELVSVE
jgi:hypothetical protein